jgi:hypothetical protein
MATVFASQDGRFFLVPDGVKLRVGGLPVQSLTGEKRRVDGEQLEPYRVEEAAAKQHVEGRLAAIEVLRRELLNFARHLEQLGRDLAAEAPPERVAALLAMAGVSENDLLRNPTATLKKVVDRLQSATMEALQPIIGERR